MSSFVWPLLIGILSLLYLSTFVLLAIVRIATGLSIQRVGYFSLKRIAYAVNDGLKVEIRDINVSVHRPSYARPTWITLRIQDLRVLAESFFLDKETARRSTNAAQYQQHNALQLASSESPRRFSGLADEALGRWARLLEMKERLKRLHAVLAWLRLVDVEFLSASWRISGICTFQVTHSTVAVETRSEVVERGKLFRHKRTSKAAQQPAEWTVILKDIFFCVDGKKPVEILDSCTVNVHGLLYRDVAGLRDTSISLKFGRVFVHQ